MGKEGTHEIDDAPSEGLGSGRPAMSVGALAPGEARSYLRRAEHLLARIEDPVALGVLRLFEAFLDAAVDPAFEAAAGQRVLVVGTEARWFTSPDGGTCDLARRDVLRRLLARLVEQHRTAPTEGLTLEALREAGWPSERIIESAAMNRIHVALTELRRRGLRRCLIRDDDRYLLDPALRVVLSDG
jgi:hypothetical protein